MSDLMDADRAEMGHLPDFADQVIEGLVVFTIREVLADSKDLAAVLPKKLHRFVDPDAGHEKIGFFIPSPLFSERTDAGPEIARDTPVFLFQEGGVAGVEGFVDVVQLSGRNL